ncbi:MAG: hypothetical protein RL329_2709, partial [Bacteroidota bacterium]
EEDITKKLYNDYAGFKKALFKDILSKDKSLDRLLLFKKTQKLLDRFLFIFFAEDKGLLQPNTVREIVNQWDTLKDLDAYQPLYNRFKQYFGYLNHGHQTPQYSIFAYNGGLFAPDAFLDNLTISDGLLYNYTQLLSGYDFETDVDTNILGHIFEHSLNETDEIAASATHTAVDKSKTKRKKDGIFYTPRYITKYIVENTVGALCQRKLDELGIDPNNMDIHADKETKNAVCKKIHQYRDWLLSITILDPACGSGAFLNQALTFLMEEHQRIDAMFKSLYDVPITLTDNVIQILENNIFGVDINEESVEIARLSLWLRTAKVGRKLNDLSRNVLCGNSLINSVKVLNSNELVWQTAFPQVFEKGGFDVIIGNPPYIKEYVNKTAFDGLRENPYYQGKMDLWTFFGCVAIDLLKNEGLVSFIAPNNWVSNAGASIFRNKMLSEGMIKSYIDFGSYNIFKEAGIQTMIYIYSKQTFEADDYSFKVKKLTSNNPTEEQIANWVNDNEESIGIQFTTKLNKVNLIDQFLPFNNNAISDFTDKLLSKAQFFLDKKEVAQGIVAPQDFVASSHLTLLDNNCKQGDGIFFISDKEKSSIDWNEAELTDIIKPFYRTNELGTYFGKRQNDYWVLYTKSDIKDNILQYPNVKKHLERFSQVITSDNKPYGLHRARDERFFISDKILSLRKCVKPTFTFSDFDCYVSQSYFVIKTNQYNHKVLTTILNSKLVAYWLRYRGKRQGDLYQIDKEPLLSIPLRYPVDNQSYISLCDKMLSLHAQLQETQTEFNQLLIDNFTKITINRALENWHQGDFGAFKKVLEKQKIEIPLKKQKEWREMFETEKTA